MLIIEFPRKYKVWLSGTDSVFSVEVPTDVRLDVFTQIKAQPWVSSVFNHVGPLAVFINRAYEITAQQAIDALSRICEYVMEPQPEMDTALKHELEELL